MNAAPIKVGMLIAYDYQYAYHSIPLIYDHADQITLAVDEHLQSWAGSRYSIEDAFWGWIRKIDVQNKIKIYRDNFYLPELDTIQNDTRERNMLAKYMGAGGWHLQIDTDEYFPNFARVAQFLRSKKHWLSPNSNPIDIGAFWVPMYKRTPEGFIFIKNAFESFPFATNCPDYQSARGSRHRIYLVPFTCFHQTWARSEEEIAFKLKNWSHSSDFNTESYFNLWKAVDQHTYFYLQNLHPYPPVRQAWPSLEYCPGKTIDAFIENYQKQFPITVPTRLLWRRRLGQIKKSWMQKTRKSP